MTLPLGAGFVLGYAPAIFPNSGQDPWKTCLLAAVKLSGKGRTTVRRILEDVFLRTGGLRGGAVGIKNLVTAAAAPMAEFLRKRLRDTRPDILADKPFK